MASSLDATWSWFKYGGGDKLKAFAVIVSAPFFF